jgi:hypothetical protein
MFELRGGRHGIKRWNKMTRRVVRLLPMFFILGMLTQAVVYAGEQETGNTTAADVGAPAKAGLEEADNVVVARVNGVDITVDSLKSMMKHMIGREGQGSPRPEEAEALRKKALDRLIFQELAYQKAKAEGLTADPKDVDSTLAALKTRLGGEEAYKGFLKNTRRTKQPISGPKRWWSSISSFSSILMTRLRLPRPTKSERWSKMKRTRIHGSSNLTAPLR